MDLWTHRNAIDIYTHLCKEYQRPPDECRDGRAVWRDVRGVRKVVLWDRDYVFPCDVQVVGEASDVPVSKEGYVREALRRCIVV